MKVLIENKIIIEDIKISNTFLSRLRGLMFYKAMPYDGIMIKPCNSIHTFFMKFDIDVLFLDQDLKVLHKVEGLNKRQLIFPIKNATSVIETSTGRLSQINIGDHLIIC